MLLALAPCVAASLCFLPACAVHFSYSMPCAVSSIKIIHCTTTGTTCLCSCACRRRSPERSQRDERARESRPERRDRSRSRSRSPRRDERWAGESYRGRSGSPHGRRGGGGYRSERARAEEWAPQDSSREQEQQAMPAPARRGPGPCFKVGCWAGRSGACVVVHDGSPALNQFAHCRSKLAVADGRLCMAGASDTLLLARCAATTMQCGEEGHMARECPNAPAGGSSHGPCYKARCRHCCWCVECTLLYACCKSVACDPHAAWRGEPALCT